MFCTKCGNRNDEGANYCYACGASLARIQPPEYLPEPAKFSVTEALNTSTSTEKSNNKATPETCGCGAVTMLIALAAFVGLFFPLAVQDSSVGLDIDFGILDHHWTIWLLLYLCLPIVLAVIGLSLCSPESDQKIAPVIWVGLLGLIFTIWYGVGASAELKMSAMRNVIPAEFEKGAGFYILSVAYLLAIISPLLMRREQKTP